MNPEIETKPMKLARRHARPRFSHRLRPEVSAMEERVLLSFNSPFYKLSIAGIESARPIPVESYNWSVTSPAVSGAGVHGKVPSDFEFTTPLSAVSQELGKAVVSGAKFDNVVLTMFDVAPGATAAHTVATWTLQNVSVASYVDSTGTDTIRLSFTRVTESFHDAKAINTIDWNFSTNAAVTFPTPRQQFAPSSPPPMSMTVTDATNASAPFVLLSAGVTSFNFGEVSNSTVPKGLGSSHVTVTTSFGAASPDLLLATLDPKRLKNVVIAMSSPRQTLTSWAFNDVTILGERIEAGAGDAPTEQIEFTYKSVTQTARNPTNTSPVQSASTTWKINSDPSPVAPRGLDAGLVTGGYTLTLPGMEGVIPVNTYSWGVTNPGPGQDGSPAPPTATLNISTRSTAASPALLYDTLTHKALDTVVLTGHEGGGKTTVTWTLKGVVLTSYNNLNGDDSIGLKFDQATFTRAVTGHPGYTAGWDFVRTAATSVAAAGPGLNPETLPPLLSMTLSDGTGVRLNSLDFEGVTGITSGLHPTFGSVTLTAPQGNGSADILSKAFAGRPVPSVVLTERDHEGRVLVSWTLSNVLIASDRISGGSFDEPVETYVLRYSGVTETVPKAGVNSESSATWNVVTNTGKYVGTPRGHGTSSVDTLTVPDIGGLIAVNTFSLGFTNPIGKTTGPKASELTVTANLSSASPKIFLDAASGTKLAQVVLSVPRPTGAPYATWTLTDVYITSYANHGGVDTFTLSFSGISVKAPATLNDGKAPVTSNVTWNFATHSGQTTDLPYHEFAAPLPPPTNMVLGDTTRADLNGFQMGNVSRTVTTGQPPVISHGNSTVYRLMGIASANLLSALLTGREIKDAKVDFRNYPTKPFTTFDLANVRIVGMRITGASGERPQESYTFANIK